MELEREDRGELVDLAGLWLDLRAGGSDSRTPCPLDGSETPEKRKQSRKAIRSVASVPCSSLRAAFPTDSWPGLEGEFSMPYMHALCRFLRSKRAGIVCPSEKDLFEAFRLTPFEKVKVVILGQDPYPNRRQAMGLAFSIPPGLRPHPLSLRNIYHELQTDLDIEPARSGDLTRWAEEESVLLLNCTLTVRAGKAKSHRGEGWMSFTNEAIRLLNERRQPVVFLLWGEEAKKKARLVMASRHKILCADHPAAPGGDFFGRSHFSKTNAFLKKKRLGEIDWRV